jgi:hypothetical protein
MGAFQRMEKFHVHLATVQPMPLPTLYLDPSGPLAAKLEEIRRRYGGFPRTFH